MSENELFDSIRKNDSEGVETLLDGDPVLLNARQNGVTPILFAIYNGHGDLARHFLDRGATMSFCEACALGDEVQALRMLGADPALLNTHSEDGFPPVGLAIFFRHPELAKALIDRGADVNAAAQNAFRVAPVHAAAAVRDAATMTRLLERGADVNARQQLGYTALHTAAQLGDEVMLELLLARGADRWAAGEDGKTPADLAAAHGHTQIVKRLTE